MQDQKPESETVALGALPAGAHAIVRQFRGGSSFVSRMAALGFTVGVEIQVIQNYGRGPLLVLVRGTRVALGCGEAAKVLVQVMDDGQSDSA